MVKKGIVKEVGTYENGIMNYVLRADDKDYLVVSNGRLAKKDVIFLRTGYEITTNGTVEDETIFTEESKISLVQT